MAANGELFIGPLDGPDRYQLWRRIGTGGEGQVWQATRELDDGTISVAVKHYHDARFGLTESLDDLATRLETQTARLRTLKTPGLAAVHESFLGPEPHPRNEAAASRNAAYFVMDYIDGLPLPEWANSEPSLTKRLSVLDDAAGALDDLHRTGQVHADIKPSNLLVQTIDIPDGTQAHVAVLVDFGVMRAITNAAPSKVIGTQGFIAPELHTGGAYTPASDLYAFAMVCAGLVCHGETANTIAQAAQDAGLPQEGIDTLLAGLSADPEQRFGQLDNGIAGWHSRLRSGMTTTFTSLPATEPAPAPPRSAPTKPAHTTKPREAEPDPQASTGQRPGRPIDSEPSERDRAIARLAAAREARTTATSPPTPSPSPGFSSRAWLAVTIGLLAVVAVGAVSLAGQQNSGSPGGSTAITDSTASTTPTPQETTSTTRPTTSSPTAAPPEEGDPGTGPTNGNPTPAVTLPNVPDLSGRPMSDAEAELADIGVAIVRTDLAYDEATRAGHVISMDPPAGSSTDEISVVVSRGPRPVLSWDAGGEFGGGDSVNLSADIPQVQGLSQGSIHARFRTTSTGAHSIIAASNADAPRTDLRVHIEGGLVDAHVRGTIKREDFRGARNYADGQWHVVVVTVDQAGSVLYIDGEQVAVSSTLGFFADIPGLNSMSIGRNVDETNPSGEWYFVGQIDYVRIYRQALGPSDVYNPN